MKGHDKGYVNHSMLLTKTSSYVKARDADNYEKNLEILYDNRKSFNRIYVPEFTWTRYESTVKLEMEFVWGIQMAIYNTTLPYNTMIYEDLVLNNERYGFKDLSRHNFLIREDNSLAFVDLESYGHWTIAQRRSEFLKGICRFPEEHLPRQVSF